jgi:hypothetical protein
VARLQAAAPVHPSAEIDWSYHAVRAGHLEVLQWLCTESQCRLWSSAGEIAARVGHVHVLQWLAEHTGKSDSHLLVMAARGGQLHVLKWLAQRPQADLNPGFRAWDEAIRHGHLHVLQWAFTGRWICQGTHCTRTCMGRAASAGQVHILEWIRQTFPTVHPDYRTWSEAFESQQLASMAWIRHRFPACPAPRSVWRAALHRELCGGQMIQWLRDNFEIHPM